MRFGPSAAALIAIVLAAPGVASARDYQPDRVVRSVDVEDLEAIVKSLDHVVEAKGMSGPNSVRAADSNGLKYLLIGTACDKNGVPDCQGVSMQLRYGTVSGATKDTIARANYLYAAVSTWSDEDLKTVGFTRYVVLDHGISMANLRANVRVLLGVSRSAMNVVKGNDPESGGD